MKLLVMGIGYVGMALLNGLQHEDVEVFATTTQPSKVELIKPLVKEVILLDPEDDTRFNAVVKICDGIVVMVAPQNNQNYEITYLDTAKKLSRLIKKRKNPPYILYTSSTSVYENIQTEWATEDLILNPLTQNGKILLETEQVLLNCAHSCILRLGGIFGPNREISRRAFFLSGKEVPGTGEEPTNHIHVDDIVSVILYCLKHRLTGIYNLVNHEHPTRNELYTRLCQNLSIPDPIWNPRLPSGKGSYKVSNQKILETDMAISFHLID